MGKIPGSLLILNGKSAGDETLRTAIALLRDEGMDIQVRVTWEKGDAGRYVKEAQQLGVDTVIAGGGDGTINEVATALVNCTGDNIPALGILPLGTANDFATSAGIPRRWRKRYSWPSWVKRWLSISPASTIKPVLSIWQPVVLVPASPRKHRKN